MPSHNTNKFNSNTIVVWKGSIPGNKPRPAFVEARDNSNEAPDTWHYSVVLLDWGLFDRVPEDELRPMTFRESIWFRHPKTGQMRVGDNAAWKVIFSHAVWLACWLAIGGIHEPDWKTFFIGLLITCFCGFWIFTHRNFTGKTH